MPSSLGTIAPSPNNKIAEGISLRAFQQKCQPFCVVIEKERNNKNSFPYKLCIIIDGSAISIM